ncbi:hypothetical protein AVEN_238675-1 [Araneus ventricosus]|uniref:Uncharacterized protein n=1 Tax=Araneus ventricosus TaxID=182803 RepID=A0A4Y2BXV3_ARAVE|nr:hypothetical protein AVEN_238675-1 [Araneus ventricosus]
MSPITLKKSRASKGSVSKVSLDRRRQERMCSGDALATPHFAHTGKTLLPWLKEQLLRHIGVDHEVHLQWIPSHVDIYGNEVADNLAKQGTAEPLFSTPSLTFDEIYSIRKNKDLKTWRVPPSHDWYKRSSPGGSIGLACDKIQINGY